MIVLGLNFGHDAGACVVKDGKILSVIQRERLARVKHAVTLDYETISAALQTAGISIQEVDYCGVTSTQHVELVTKDPERVSIQYASHEGHIAPSPLYEQLHARGAVPFTKQTPLLDTLYNAEDPDAYFVTLYFPEYRTIPRSALGHAPNIDGFGTCSLWNDGAEQDLDWLKRFPAREVVKIEPLRHAFHYPLALTLDGRTIPGYFIYHHLAHAASAYYPVTLDRAAIVCHDGGTDEATHYNSGFIFLGEGRKIIPIAPHHLGLGRLYEGVAQSLALGAVGGPGKLMGLTSYGKPTFFNSSLVGNRVTWANQTTQKNFVKYWLRTCEENAKSMGYDTSCFALGDRITEPFNSDIAASTQHLFEEILLRTVQATYEMFTVSGFAVRDLCYAGGIALNCPANTRVYNESSFDNVHIPPWCDDGGLAIGAALTVCHNILDTPTPENRDQTYCAYLGRETSTDDVERVLETYRGTLRWVRCQDPAQEAARAVADDKVIGWMEGRSEIGPRALGHRSIFANAALKTNWGRVNEIKGRESWRPFAPMVLEGDAEKWFTGGPSVAPHMLYTYDVKDDTVPAVTHVDGTARVQTVRPEDGQFHDILVHLKRLTGVPVMMNTSFNGPGEPIVDTAEDAIRFFVNSHLDAVFLNGIKVERS